MTWIRPAKKIYSWPWDNNWKEMLLKKQINEQHWLGFRHIKLTKIRKKLPGHSELLFNEMANFFHYYQIAWSCSSVESNSSTVTEKQARLKCGRLSHIKDFEIGNHSFSAMHAVLRESVTTGWLGVRTMCPSWVTCLLADCCFYELVLTIKIRFSVHVGLLQGMVCLTGKSFLS